ncbi:putative tubulin polyglutamylase complex subunit 2-like [Apostichopus japonicus]|uniref:Putative tubulin polyglutamylase complex subunit 2-like n=1 Tax=Stichopus japonicus TaxID=307972 RepID=A0A2G8K138_STIJA|nr:putative tubulin polyglutamylase complex subunit 2-like [Apostichopus japonicus]
MCQAFNFYFSTDDILPIGLMEVNSIDKLTKVCESKQAASDPTIADLQCDRAKDQTPLAKSVNGFPHFDGRSRIFELDACREYGKVCLVYHNTETGSPAQGAEVWFLDRSFRWHFLTDSYSEYFQMMLVHLGLPEWQYIFTDIGLSPQVQTWFHMFAPMRLVIDAEDKAKSVFQREGDTAAISEVTLDNNRVFKAKAEKRAKSGNQKKKANQNKMGTSVMSVFFVNIISQKAWKLEWILDYALYSVQEVDCLLVEVI